MKTKPMNVIPVNISDILEKGSAVLPEDGKLVYGQLKTAISSKDVIVELNFDGLKFITTAFLNDSVGRYLLEFPQMEANITWKPDLEERLVSRIKRTIALATNDKLRAAHGKALDEVLA